LRGDRGGAERHGDPGRLLLRRAFVVAAGRAAARTGAPAHAGAGGGIVREPRAEAGRTVPPSGLRPLPRLPAAWGAAARVPAARLRAPQARVPPRPAGPPRPAVPSAGGASGPAGRPVLDRRRVPPPLPGRSAPQGGVRRGPDRDVR